MPRIIWGTSAAAAAAIALAGCGSTTNAGAAASEASSSATPTSTATAGTQGTGTGSDSPGKGSPSTGTPGTGTGDGSGTGTGDGSGTGTGDGSGKGTGTGSGEAPGDGRGGDGGGGGGADYPLCTSDTLSVYLTNRDFVETNRYVTLILTNTSRTTCNLRGFASLQLINDDGLVETRVRQHGTPRTVTLRGHDTAYERLHWTSELADDESVPCQPTATTLQVYTLYQTRPLTTPWNNGPVCRHGTIWLTPIAPSTTH